MPASLALAIAAFAVGVDTYIVAATLPSIALDLHQPIGAVGLLASAYALPTALLAPVFGPLSDRRGRRAAMLLGLAIFAAATLGCIVAPSLPLLVIARGVSGLGAAIILPAALAYAGDMPTPAERTRTIGLVASMFPLSTLLGLPVGALAGLIAGWRASFAFILLVALVALGLVSRLRPERSRARTATSYLATYRVILAERRALPVLLVTFLWVCGSFGVFVYIGEFIHEAYGVPPEQASFTYMIVGAGGLVATRMSGRIVAAIGARGTVMAGILLFVTAVIALPFSAVAFPLTLTVFWVWAFGTWFALPALQGIVAGISDTARGTLLAFNSSAQNLAAVIAPVLIGALLGIGGFELATRIAAAIGVTALLTAWLVLPRPVPAANASWSAAAPEPA
jgi:predicted MFS family arabinose efflux permease